MPFARGIATLVGAATIVALAVPATAAPSSTLAPQAPVRSAIASDTFYFVMTDRYRDGNPANNSGGSSGPASVTGYDPASDAYFHGGDLAGLTGRCDGNDANDDGLARIARLGFTAIWITPPVVQRTVQGSSAAYHGYWGLDLTKPDPHLGTEAEFGAFVDCAHRLGMKVFVDVVPNHTADVISFPQGTEYVPIEDRPYRTAAGKAFNPWSFTSGTSFPLLSATRSFAKTPVVDPGYATAKVPAFLNEVTNYHNRGDINWSTCDDRCFMDGDFAGLDDLMTEDWQVVQGLADAYGSWITKYGVDGFRIDTAKHVDPAFFKRWLPLIATTARAANKPAFTAFGEAWLTDAAQLSALMLDRRLPSVLDFPFQDTVRGFVTGSATGRSLSALFDQDDLYTSATTNAYGLATFLGNHDMGRIGFFLEQNASLSDQERLERDLLAQDILYLTRGVPVVYYGDEVGMTGSGDGTDRKARQDMFATQVGDWQTEPRIGSAPVGTGSSLDAANPVGAQMALLAGLRRQQPALAQGAQITRLASGRVFAASRIDAARRLEVVVAFNGGDAAQRVTIPTATPSASWTPLLGTSTGGTDAKGRLGLVIPARSAAVVVAGKPLPVPAKPSIRVTVRPDALTGGYQVSASVPGVDPSTVTFGYRKRGSSSWTTAGTDDARPFRVFLDPARVGKNAQLEIMAVVTDSVGRTARSNTVTQRMTPLF